MTFCLDVVNIVQKTEQIEAFGLVMMRKREALGYSQKYLAERSGVTRSYISQLEAGRTLKDGETQQKPSKEISDALADALGESRDYFRKLNGHPTLNEESIDDIISVEFASALTRYRLLDEAERDFLQRQNRSTIDFLLTRKGIDPDGPITGQRILQQDPKTVAAITLEEAKRRGKKK